jgi:hypothetical protein
MCSAMSDSRARECGERTRATDGGARLGEFERFGIPAVSRGTASVSLL